MSLAGIRFLVRHRDHSAAKSQPKNATADLADSKIQTL